MDPDPTVVPVGDLPEMTTPSSVSLIPDR